MALENKVLGANFIPMPQCVVDISCQICTSSRQAGKYRWYSSCDTSATWYLKAICEKIQATGPFGCERARWALWTDQGDGEGWTSRNPISGEARATIVPAILVVDEYLSTKVATRGCLHAYICRLHPYRTWGEDLSTWGYCERRNWRAKKELGCVASFLGGWSMEGLALSWCDADCDSETTIRGVPTRRSSPPPRLTKTPQANTNHCAMSPRPFSKTCMSLYKATSWVKRRATWRSPLWSTDQIQRGGRIYWKDVVEFCIHTRQQASVCGRANIVTYVGIRSANIITVKWNDTILSIQYTRWSVGPACLPIRTSPTNSEVYAPKSKP